ncbi:MAG TPA: DUF6232 family protein [Actinoplanes sp.]|nr:DUF6232 family protein [Actinoplanes sp.]
MRTRTYYRGPDAVVTSEVFIWRTTPPKIFVIRELKRVGIVRRDIDRRTRIPRPGAGSVVLAVAIWPIVDTPILITTGVLAVAVPAVAVFAYRHHRPRLWELHAVYRGTETVLYAATDARVFNQVSRALRRAMEDNDPHITWDDEAAA